MATMKGLNNDAPVPSKSKIRTGISNITLPSITATTSALTEIFNLFFSLATQAQVKLKWQVQKIALAKRMSP
ncbi:hypothetical protein [Hoylesella saccharolytica]|uniref:hypothetical protein n=1 Tax=Hoylesella saccharolytica TaxID=633701 RepID=UPI0028D037A6|nr:hypothetical protein [Hoylesella saccharolytica]